MTIRVLDQANVPDGILYKMERYVINTLSGIEVDVTWVDCKANIEVCKTTRGVNEFWLRILGQVPSDAGTEQLGFTQSSGIQCVNVIYPRIAKLVEMVHGDPDQILGAAAVHEIGHLYLGDNNRAHSKTGIMSGAWSVREIELISIGELKFNREQGQRIRGAMRAGLGL